jgi:hypothetical protein
MRLDSPPGDCRLLTERADPIRLLYTCFRESKKFETTQRLARKNIRNNIRNHAQFVRFYRPCYDKTIGITDAKKAGGTARSRALNRAEDPKPVIRPNRSVGVLDGRRSVQCM